MFKRSADIAWYTCPRCGGKRIADPNPHYWPRFFALRRFRCVACKYLYELSWQWRLAFVLFFVAGQVCLWVVALGALEGKRVIDVIAAPGLILAAAIMNLALVRSSVGHFQPWAGQSVTRFVVNLVGIASLYASPFTIAVFWYATRDIL